MPSISAVCLWGLVLSSAVAAQGWPQWGGPHRNFTVDANGLAEAWPAGGPKQLWSRALGEGHSSIVVDADRLFTMYSKGEQEFVVALDRTTGRTIWEKANAAPTAGPVEGVRRNASGARLCVQPPGLQEHGDRDRRRPGTVAHGVRSKDRRRDLEETDLPSVTVVAHRDHR